MRLLTPGIDRNDTGGGSTFLKNFRKAMEPFGHVCVIDGDYDVLVVAAASLADKEVVAKAALDKKPIILRVDNILEDKKNRNSGMPKMIQFAKLADIIVYQSEWAKRMLAPLLADGVVVCNGVDTDIFHPDKAKGPKETMAPHIFFYSKYSRGEGKNVNVVQQYWREHSLHRPQDTLLLAGRFADDNFQVNHPFEFHNEENFIFDGAPDSQEKMAHAMRKADVALLPYFADACSNTILEAQACGLYTIYDKSGGTPEIIYPGMGEVIAFDIFSNKNDLIRRISEARENFNFEAFKKKYSLEKMGQTYDGLIRMVTQSTHEIG